jgi:phthalate 3,4-dioxygenase beta subunit
LNGAAAPLPYTHEAHQLAHQFLVEEAHLLDTQQLEEWLGLLCPDVRYVMPVAVTRSRRAGADQGPRPGRDGRYGSGDDGGNGMAHLDEDLFSLRRRVERLATEHAWTEDPPSRLRHFVTNVRTFAGPGPDELSVQSNVLLFRSRGDTRPPDLLSAGRHDVLRRGPDGGWRLARREVHVDEAVLRTQNLAILL